MQETTDPEKIAHKDTSDVLQFLPALHAYARSLTRQYGEADDLVQTTLMKAIANYAQFRKGTNLRAWLFTIMRNTFLNEIKKRTREMPAAKDCASSMSTCAPAHDYHIEGQRLIRAIARLPQHYREILVLVLVIGETYENASAICGCEMGTVKSRLNRARAMLIEDLGSSDLDDFLATQ
ncbi:MAG: sigma-70 family RNA polymerase sigma factor [Loktanella sp.]|nr:sigma-70 family RNA polymerase sigma factor [Loktanella sp.]